jgi:alpha-L-rhamnosidase
MAAKDGSAGIVAGNLRTEYAENPVGLGEARPRLSWKVKPAPGFENRRGLAQSAYQILAASSALGIVNRKADLWDSGKAPSNQTLFIEYGGKPLASGQLVHWGVRVWDQDDLAAPPITIASFEMGLLDRADWKAQWIGSHIVGSPKASAPVPFFRKSFSIDPGKTIASARLYATALGVYEISINGQRVGQDVFTPGWTDYRKRVQYQAYDVTKLLKASGENVAGAVLGDGWYCGFTGNIQRRQFYGDRPKLFAQIVIQFDDGSSKTIATDNTWKTATGPIVSSDMLIGESYDARLEMTGWDTPGFGEDGRWTPAVVFPDPGIELSAMTGPTVKAVKELAGSIPTQQDRHPWATTGDNWIFDFGQNLVGRVRLKVKGKAGTTITLRHAELLDKDGKLYTVNLRAAVQIDHYTLRGDPSGEVFEPRFTFHGFRYAEVMNYPGEIAPDTATAIVLHSEMDHIGSFECSDPLVNQLQSNIEWGQRGNFLEIPTDCPQRDERLGWTGDAQVFVRTAAFNFDVSGFFAKWTKDLRDAQSPKGEYPDTVPNNCDLRIEQGVERGLDGGPAWADAGVICPWTMLLVNGDRRLIERHYESMCKFVDHLAASSEQFELIRAHPDCKQWRGYGDWLSQDGKDGLMGATPKDLIGTAFLAYDARLLAGIAKLLGKPSDAAKYAKLGDAVASAFCRRFVTTDGLIAGHTQTAYLLALHFDLIPQDQRAAVLAELVANIRNDGNRLNTGFVGSPYLNHVLTEGGRLDVAYELLMQKRWPSWLFAVTQGATTIWERWDGWTPEKGFQDPGMNSFNHYAYGAIGAWLYQKVAGIEIDPERPGYEHGILRPHPLAGGPLTFAKASIETLRGRIESGWKIESGRLSYSVKIPPNVTATVYVPASDAGAVTESGKPAEHAAGIVRLREEKGVAIFGLQSGSYEFRSELSLVGK